MEPKLKGYRFPWSIIHYCVRHYHRFNDSFRDIEEMMFYRGIQVSYESIRTWCRKFAYLFTHILNKRQTRRSDKWHLDEMVIRIGGEKYILWRAVDKDGYELDIFIQKHKNKKAAIRFLKRLLQDNPAPRVVVTDKLRSYVKPIQALCPWSDHRKHKGLNNRAENAHQPTRRREESMIKMKSVNTAQQMLQLMGVLRNYFSINVGRYKNTATVCREKLRQAIAQWKDAASQIYCA